jgi:hypothetical protein
LASSFQHVVVQTLHAHPGEGVAVEVEEKHCQDDADGAGPELLNGDEAVYGSGAGDGGQYGQLCRHHYLTQSRVEKEELKNVTHHCHMRATQDETHSVVQGFSRK